MTKQHSVEGCERSRTACAYVRTSSAEQEWQEAAIASQIAAIVDWCAENNVVLVDVFSEASASGSDNSRPEFGRMMASATGPDRPYDMVIVQSLSRFTRDLAQQAVSYQRLQETGVEQVSVDEQ